jgi:ABC-type antimicrobial peptide transport system permease subunit
MPDWEAKIRERLAPLRLEPAREAEIVEELAQRIAAGAIAGLLLSYALTRLLAAQLWGVSATNSWTFSAAVALIFPAGAAACILPARKATQVDPLIAIRCE